MQLKVRETEPTDMEAAFKHVVRLETYDKAVNDQGEQYRMRNNRGRCDDGLPRKVMQLEKEVDRAKDTESAARAPSATDESLEELEIRSVERGICPIAKSTINKLFFL